MADRPLQRPARSRPPDRARDRIGPRRRAGDSPAGDTLAAEASPKSQPWAETAAPPASDKRPLEAVLAEYEARVAAAPGARAGHPNEPHPGEAYLEKLSPAPRSTGKRPKRRWQGGRKRRGGRGGRGGGGAEVARPRERCRGRDGTRARGRPLRLRRDAGRIHPPARGARGGGGSESSALLASVRATGPAAATLRAILDRVEREVLEHQRSGALDEIDVAAVVAARLRRRRARPRRRPARRGAAHRAGGLVARGAPRPGRGPPARLPARSRHPRGALLERPVPCPVAARAARVSRPRRAISMRSPSPLRSGGASRRRASSRRRCERSGPRRHRTVMVGDSEAADIAGAHAAGMRAVLAPQERRRRASATPMR